MPQRRAVTAAVSVAIEGARIPISRARVTTVARAVLKAEKVRHAMLSITFVSDRAMRGLNKRHLRRDRVTDVIAFGFRRVARSEPLVGDVYIAPGAAKASARANGIPMREEIVRLIVHGILHVLGYDHPEADRTRSAMWRRQERLVARLAAAR